MTYDIETINGLPVCLARASGEECVGCYGVGKDDDGTPICMAQVRDDHRIATLARGCVTIDGTSRAWNLQRLAQLAAALREERK